MTSSGGSSDRADVVVVGAGIAGLCAAWRLALAGRDVVVLERDTIGNPSGSSHGAVRIFRFAYPDPFWVRLAQAALPLWRELEGGSEEIVRTTGGLDAGPVELVEPIASALDACGAVVERLTPGERASRFGWLDAGDAPGVWSPDTGVIFAERALGAVARAARALGARIVEKAPVRALSRAPDGGVIVDTDTGSYRARVVVVAAGGWAGSILSALGVTLPLRVTREQVMFFTPRPGERAPELPFIHYGPEVHRYGVPAFGAAPGFKVGEHGTGRLAVAGAGDGEIAEPEASRLRTYVAHALPGLVPNETASETCLYTSTPSQDFVLDARDGVVVASPCSGHGFKFGPLTGEIIACLATGRTPPVEIGRFALAAFG